MRRYNLNDPNNGLSEDDRGRWVSYRDVKDLEDENTALRLALVHHYDEEWSTGEVHSDEWKVCFMLEKALL